MLKVPVLKVFFLICIVLLIGACAQAPVFFQPSSPTGSPTLRPASTTNAGQKIEQRTWLVPEDYKNLADAVQVALPGDIVKVSPFSESTGQVTIDKPLTIIGNKMDYLPIMVRFLITSGKVTLKNLTLYEITLETKFNTDVPVTIEDCRIGDINVSSPNIRFVHNTFGGKLLVKPSGAVTLTTSRFPASQDGVETLKLEISGSGSIVEKNDFWAGIVQVMDNGSNNTLRNNYWAKWDATKPVPVKGSAKSVDRLPSSTPVTSGWPH
ncbi:MAG: hypothetical protein HW384_1641 [Dehalococcoidia bacterium]|nr:hypothetical protein [Dehalococcoidia bacterium]MBF8304008.1 hypothetical protein [Dehalococcoidia bacterium]